VQLGFAAADGTLHAFAPVQADLARTHEVEWSATRRSGLSSRGSSDAGARLVARIDGVATGTWRGDAVVDLKAWTVSTDEIHRPDLAARFAGIVHSATHLAGERPMKFGAVRIRLAFPFGKTAAREPLVVTGETGRGDQLFVEYLEDGHVRFGLDHWGKAPLWSEPVAVPRGEPQVLEVSLGSFPGGAGAERPVLQPVRVRLNGRPCWSLESKLFPIDAKDVYIGQNPIGGTTCGPAFTGSVLSLEWLDVELGSK
jgi:hypothetical protein